MLKANDYVKLNTGDGKLFYGVVVNVNMFSVDVSFAKPIDNELNVPMSSVIKVTEKEYYDFLGIEAKNGNYAIDHVKDNNKSIEQQINDIYYGGTLEDNYDVFQQMLAESEGYGYPEFKLKGNDDNLTIELSDLKQKQYYARLTGKWKSALKQAYIDLALQTNDKEWFMELMNEE